MDQAAHIGGLPIEPSRTTEMTLEASGAADNDIGGIVSPDDTLVERFVEEEMARTATDVLARRTRSLFLDARAAAEAAESVARAMAARLGRDDAWVSRQIEAVESASRRHLPDDSDKLL